VQLASKGGERLCSPETTTLQPHIGSMSTDADIGSVSDGVAGWAWTARSCASSVCPSDPRRAILISAATGMILFGSVNVVLKESMVFDGFYSPGIWTTATMVGQIFFLPLHCCTTLQAGDAENESRPQATLGAILGVTSLDILALGLINTTYNVLPGSIIQMLRACKIIFTCVLSLLVLGKKQQPYHLLGVTLNIVGLLLAGLASVSSTYRNASEHPMLVWQALCVGILSQSVSSFGVVYEAKVMSQYDISPLLLTGSQGAIGMPLCIAILLAGHFTGLSSALSDVRALHTTALLGLFCLFLLSAGAFNFAGITVTRHSSPVLRTMLEIARMAIIWLVEVMLGWQQINPLELGGFVLTTFGALIYGRGIVIPLLEPARSGPYELVPTGDAADRPPDKKPP